MASLKNLLGRDEKDDTIKERYLKGVVSIRRELQDYWLNSAFTEGYQWTYWLPGDNTLNDLDVGEDRFQAVINRTRANHRYLLANALQRPLAFSVLPSATDDASLRAARAGEALLSDLAKQQQWETLREENTHATIKGGTAGLAVEWDDYEKEAVVSPLGITEFIVEPGVRRYQDARWWIKVQALPPSMVKDMYPEKFKGKGVLPPADSRAGLATMQHKLVGLNKYGGDDSTDLTLVLTYYEKPHRGCEKGRFVVEVDNETMEDGDWPFDFKELNLVVLRETVLEDQWTGSTFMNDVRRVQVMLNLLWTQVAEHVRNVGTGRILVPQSAWDIVTDTFTDEPGQMVPWPDGLEKPDFMNPPSFGSYIERLLDRAAEYIDDIMGVHDISRGVAPGAVESGYGIQILTENDTSPVGRLVREQARAWSRVGQMVLAMYEQRGQKRQVTVDMGLGAERLDFNPQEDLKGQRDVVIPEDALVPRSRAAQESRAQSLLQMGIITDMVTYARVADLADADDMINAIDPDAAKAMRENEMMAEGNNEHADLLAEYDDHQIHEKVHGAFLKSRRFELLSEEDRADAVNHYQAHKTISAELQAKMMRQQATMQSASSALTGEPSAPQQGGGPEAQLPPELANPDKAAAEFSNALQSEFPG